MTQADFPDTIYRVILNSEGNELKVVVTDIPCKKTAKVSKTIHKRSIKHTLSGEIQSFFGNKIMYMGYCLEESQIQPLIDEMIKTARETAANMLKRAIELNDTAQSEAMISRKEWSPS